MAPRLFRCAALLAVLAVCVGCRIGRVSLSVYDDPHHYRPVHVTRVHVPAAHVCTYDCHEHYWDGAGVVVIAGGHHHSPDCGHHWNGSHWVVLKRHSAKRIHHGPKRLRKFKRVR